jgi:dTDP-4-amino-4,6-dideoxygalactose transaminase
MINVTKTFFPPEETYQKHLSKVWLNGWLTNHGEMSSQLANELSAFLGCNNMVLTSNGTISLQMAMKALNLKGEVITTPFSYIATSAAIVWENLTPVFVDIDPDYLTIDEEKIEESITKKTSAILATHVFGNPCNVASINKIAKKHDLKVIYDAAHCFNVKYLGKSIFEFGDVSTCSFHATKLFHTAEGGAVFSNSTELISTLKYLGNFGHNGQYDFHGLGTNAKMSELHAAMGLSVLEHIGEIIEGRKRVVELYKHLLNFNGIREIKIREHTEWNYSYYPIIFDSEETLLNCLESLNSLSIFPRRYFYPSLNTVNFLKGGKMPVSEFTAQRILCLPLYPDLEERHIISISSIINKVLTQSILTV